MTKPFDFRELTARVKVLLKRNKEIVADAPEQIEYADLNDEERGVNRIKFNPWLKISIPKSDNAVPCPE